jgi:glycosyltransferase involved in cell wall biosynthesis
VAYFYPFLLQGDKKYRVFDIYSPYLLEIMQREKDYRFADRIATYENLMVAISAQSRLGDFFICASEKQLDNYLGMLLAAGRLNPFTQDQSETFRKLIDVVPFGLPRGVPEHSRPAMKGVHKSIGREDQVILWGGGVWNHLDAVTLIRAMPLVLEQRPNVKLFFMGIKRPNPTIKQAEAVDQIMNLSRQLGLYETSVFFNDWVPYHERQNYWLEADVGASLHVEHTETRFSFRTRLLDAIWTGLPMVCTRGDVLGEMMAANGLAELVEPEDVEGVAQALLRVLTHPELRTKLKPRFQQVAENYSWEVVTQPLFNYCLNPYHAADRAYIRQQKDSDPRLHSSLQYRVQRALRYGGVAGLVSETRQYLRWKMKTFRKL